MTDDDRLSDASQETAPSFTTALSAGSGVELSQLPPQALTAVDKTLETSVADEQQAMLPLAAETAAAVDDDTDTDLDDSTLSTDLSEGGTPEQAAARAKVISWLRSGSFQSHRMA